MANTTIDTEFVFATIPIIWFRTYHKILELMVCYGERYIINPNCKCLDNDIIKAYNLFQSAVAAYNLDKEEQGTAIINHIESILSGYTTSSSFTATIDGKTYLFTETDIEELENVITDSI